MTQAFKSPLPTTAKFVLVALCDSANDQGECYPSISTIGEKCSLSERAVQGAVSTLERGGYVRREFRAGRSTIYWINPTPAADAPPQDVHPTPARRAPPPPQDVHPTPAVGAPITVTEPSIDPSLNLWAPTVLGDRPAVAEKRKAYRVPNCPYEALVEAYKARLPSLAQPAVLNNARREHMRGRWAEVCGEEKFTEAQGIEFFEWYFTRVSESKFLLGRVPGRTWKANFDWLFLPTNFAKVIDGNYHKEAA